jgi:hypothetical protein
MVLLLAISKYSLKDSLVFRTPGLILLLWINGSLGNILEIHIIFWRWDISISTSAGGDFSGAIVR